MKRFFFVFLYLETVSTIEIGVRNAVHISARGCGPPVAFAIYEDNTLSLFYEIKSETNTVTWGHLGSKDGVSWSYREPPFFLHSEVYDSSIKEGCVIPFKKSNYNYLVVATKYYEFNNTLMKSVRNKWSIDGLRAFDSVSPSLHFAIAHGEVGNYFQFNDHLFFTVSPESSAASCQIDFYYIYETEDQLMALPAGSITLDVELKCRKPSIFWTRNSDDYILAMSFHAHDRNRISSHVKSQLSGYLVINLFQTTKFLPIAHPAINVRFVTQNIQYFDYSSDAQQFVFQAFNHQILAIGFNYFEHAKRRQWQHGLTVVRQLNYDHKTNKIHQGVYSKIPKTKCQRGQSSVPKDHLSVFNVFGAAMRSSVGEVGFFGDFGRRLMMMDDSSEERRLHPIRSSSLTAETISMKNEQLSSDEKKVKVFLTRSMMLSLLGSGVEHAEFFGDSNNNNLRNTTLDGTRGTLKKKIIKERKSKDSLIVQTLDDSIACTYHVESVLLEAELPTSRRFLPHPLDEPTIKERTMDMMTAGRRKRMARSAHDSLQVVGESKCDFSAEWIVERRIADARYLEFAMVSSTTWANATLTIQLANIVEEKVVSIHFQSRARGREYAIVTTRGKEGATTTIIDRLGANFPNPIYFSILIDKTIIEIFLEDGAYVVTKSYELNGYPLNRLCITGVADQDLYVDSFQLYKIGPIWKGDSNAGKSLTFMKSMVIFLLILIV